MTARAFALAVVVACAPPTAASAHAETLAAPAVHDYVLSCAGCHKLDGTGSARVPSLRDTGAVLARAGGREYLLRVPGAAQAPLSDARLAAVLNFVVTEFGGATPEPPFSADEVDVTVIAVEPDKRRIALSMVEAARREQDAAEHRERQEQKDALAKANETRGLGTFGDLLARSLKPKR